MNKLGLVTGWLVIFDQRAGLLENSERTTMESVRSPTGYQMTVIRS